MKNIVLYSIVLSVFFACESSQNKSKSLENNSFWLGKLVIDSSSSVRFNFSVNVSETDSSFVTIYNGEEKLKQALTV